jgi:hypothetical protein
MITELAIMDISPQLLIPFSHSTASPSNQSINNGRGTHGRAQEIAANAETVISRIGLL